MHRLLVALLVISLPAALEAHSGHSFAPPGPGSAETPKEELLVPPADAARYVVVSDSAQHGQQWRWTLPDGRIAYRHSESLRGWITETDATVQLGADGLPSEIHIRGVSFSGDAAESYTLGPDGTASWTSLSDSGSGPAHGAAYVTAGGPGMLTEHLINRLVVAGEDGIALLPSGRAKLQRDTVATVEGPDGPKPVQLAFIRGLTTSPIPVWLDEQGKWFANVGWTSLMPAGYEDAARTLRAIQDKATAEAVRAVAARFLTSAARAPVLFDNVRITSPDGSGFLEDQAVLTEDGMIVEIGAAGSLTAPTGARTIDGRGKTLVPGLWDAHMHIGNDWDVLANVATGMTSFRSPGTLIDRAADVRTRRAASELLMAKAWVQPIIDRKDPLAAQGATTVSSIEETIAAVRETKSAGLWGVKFYTSMDPAWIAPGAAEAKRLGLHVSGHVPAGMRPLEAVRAGYDELTHINFVVMQGMPQEVVDVANTAARIEGPARHAKDLDLDAPPMRDFIAELAERGTWVDPTLAIFEHALTMDGGEPAPAYAPYMGITTPVLDRAFKAGGYPLLPGLTRDDYRQSFAKLLELVGALHRAGVPIVAGTDGWGIELVRELELYQKAGMTPAEALATATLAPARLVGADGRTGSIAIGKEADLLLVDGDVSRDLGALRRVEQVMMDGTLMDGSALREAAGFIGRPR
jgi:imidazolonepropionase-like amidohydrolase